MISGERILVTGVTGTIGRGARTPSRRSDNEVWGVARFGDAATREAETFHAVATPPPTRTLSTREELEAAGVTVRRVDLGSGDFEGLPDDFTYVLHLAWLRADIAHLEDALRANVEGAGLVLQHCRKAKAALGDVGHGRLHGQGRPLVALPARPTRWGGARRRMPRQARPASSAWRASPGSAPGRSTSRS